MNKKTIVGLVIAGLFVFLRLWIINEKVDFSMDQGLHLLEVKEMYEQKRWRLIGPEVTSKNYQGRSFFIGGNYYYLLLGLGVISNWDPLKITFLFGLIELLAIGFVGWWLGLVPAIFLLVSPYLIWQGRFFWNPDLLIPISVGVMYFFTRFNKNNNLKDLFGTMFLVGLGIACHYSALIWIIITFFILAKKINVKKILVSIVGLIAGNFPWVVFELKHNFYNTKTLLAVFSQTDQLSELTVHYFIYPLLIPITVLITKKMKGVAKWTIFGILIFGQLLIVNNEKKLVNKYWGFSEQNKVVDEIIKGGCPNNFNIAATINGDTRAYNLRYLLDVKKCAPLAVDQYPQATMIYLIAPIDRPPEKESVWEVTSIGKVKVNNTIRINDGVSVYQLIANGN